MKLAGKTALLKYLTLCAGGLGLALRFAMYATGIDGRGLLIAGHWTQIAVVTVTLLILAALILLCRRISGSERYTDCYPASATAALGAALGGGAVLATAISEFSLADRAELLVSVLSLAAGASLLILAAFRLLGKQPTPLFHALLSLFFAMRMVRQFRFWSADPQLMDYCFYLSAYLTLMLTAYHHAAFDADIGKHNQLWLFSLASVYLCCICLNGEADFWLLLGCGIWAFTNLTALTARRQRPALNLSEVPDTEG